MFISDGAGWQLGKKMSLCLIWKAEVNYTEISLNWEIKGKKLSSAQQIFECCSGVFSS